MSVSGATVKCRGMLGWRVRVEWRGGILEDSAEARASLLSRISFRIHPQVVFALFTLGHFHRCGSPDHVEFPWKFRVYLQSVIGSGAAWWAAMHHKGYVGNRVVVYGCFVTHRYKLSELDKFLREKRMEKLRGWGVDEGRESTM